MRRAPTQHIAYAIGYDENSVVPSRREDHVFGISDADFGGKNTAWAHEAVVDSPGNGSLLGSNQQCFGDASGSGKHLLLHQFCVRLTSKISLIYRIE